MTNLTMFLIVLASVTILVAPVASADPAPEGEDPDDGGLGNCVDINTSEWPPAITVDPTC